MSVLAIAAIAGAVATVFAAGVAVGSHNANKINAAKAAAAADAAKVEAAVGAAKSAVAGQK